MRLQAFESRLSVAVADHLVGDLLKLPQPDAAPILELHLEAARDAQPLMAGGGNAKIIASRICCNCSSMSASRSRPGSVPACRSARDHGVNVT